MRSWRSITAPAIIPARVKRPRDKPVVEGNVRFVAGQVAAILRNRQFVGLTELNEAIFDQVAAINARPFRNGRTPGWWCSNATRSRS